MPTDHGPTVVAANIALASVALVAVLLPIIPRYVSKMPLKSDDLLIIGALVSLDILQHGCNIIYF